MSIKVKSGRDYKVKPPGNPLPLDSRFVRLNSKNFLLITTFKVPSNQSLPNPLLAYALNDDFSLKSDIPFEVCDVDHIRNFKKLKTPWGEGIILADHGLDAPPFRGSKPKLLVEKEGRLVNFSQKLKISDGFYFDIVPIKNELSGYDDIMFTVFPSDWSHPNFLKIENDEYVCRQEVLPNEWVSNEYSFMNCTNLSNIVGAGQHIFLGICDSKTPNLSHNKIISLVNGTWKFNEEFYLPEIKKELGWGTVYSDVALANGHNNQWHFCMLNHNHGFSKATAQVLNIEKDKKIIEEDVDFNSSILNGLNVYFHKAVFFDIDRDGQKEILITLRENHNWNYTEHGSDIIVLKKSKDGVWRPHNLFFEDMNHSSIENIDVIKLGDIEYLLVKYFSTSFSVYDFSE